METKRGVGNRFHLSFFSIFSCRDFFFGGRTFAWVILLRNFFKRCPTFVSCSFWIFRGPVAPQRAWFSGNSVSIFMYTLYTTLLIALSRLC